MTVESDHKLLETIFKRNIQSIPARLQCIMFNGNLKVAVTLPMSFEAKEVLIKGTKKDPRLQLLFKTIL